MLIGEANKINTLLRFLLQPEAGISPADAADAAEYLAGQAYKALRTGVTPQEARKLVEDLAARRPEEKRLGDAIDWLLNSRHLHSDVVAAFWAVTDGWATTDQADRGFIGGRPIEEIAKERETSRS